MERAISLFGQVIMDKLGQQNKRTPMVEIIDEAYNTSIRPISSYLSNFIGDHPGYQVRIV